HRELPRHPLRSGKQRGSRPRLHRGLRLGRGDPGRGGRGLLLADERTLRRRLTSPDSRPELTPGTPLAARVVVLTRQCSNTGSLFDKLNRLGSESELSLLSAQSHVGPVGLEPTTHGLKVRCSTYCARGSGTG